MKETLQGVKPIQQNTSLHKLVGTQSSSNEVSSSHRNVQVPLYGIPK